MKKVLALILCGIMLFSVMSLTGCSKEEPLKLGLGTVSYFKSVANADADTNGKADATTTFAAVLLDKDGKIIDCAIDTVDYALNFTYAGKFVKIEDTKTKYEKGENYGMKAAGAKKEWFEQVDAFVSVAKGKNLDEVKALVADAGKGNADVVAAGCTIIVADFVKALEKAIANAKDSNATQNDKLNLGIISTPSGKDASEEAPGSVAIDATVSAASVDADGKVTAIITDALQAQVAFNLKGETEVKANDEIKTKGEKGENYGMKAAGAKKEWFEQVAEFDKACIGKDASEIAKLVNAEGKAADDIQAAGCTIIVSDIVKAAEKAAK